MNQLKARSTEELVSKADRAADAEGISRAELIREAVEEYADKILDEATDAVNSATDAPDDFDYLADLGSEVESLENLSEAAEEANKPYPVSHDIDVDWNDEVKGWSRHRLPVIRAWLDASDSPAVEDDQMRAYLRDDFDVAESTVYRDLREIPQQGCAFPCRRLTRAGIATTCVQIFWTQYLLARQLVATFMPRRTRRWPTSLMKKLTENTVRIVSTSTVRLGG